MDSQKKREIFKKLLRPIVRHGLRRALSIHDFVASLKMALVEVAQEEIEAAGEVVNVSRLSVLTGMYRAELKTFYVEGKKPSDEPQSVLGRVIVQWEQGARFRTVSGSPRILSLDEFYALVNIVTKAVHPASVLFEHERNKAVERSVRGLKLVRGTEIVAQNEERAFDLASRDFETTLSAATANILADGDPGHLHHRTEFDNIYVDSLPEIRSWILAEGRAFHRRLREFLSQHDKDLSDVPHPGKVAGAKVSVSLASFAELAPESVGQVGRKSAA